MKFKLEEMTIQSQYVLDRLKAFCSKVQTYDNFEPEQTIRIFVDEAKDFTAFESVKYRLCFNSTAHKMGETVSSPYSPLCVPFSLFYHTVEQL